MDGSAKKSSKLRQVQSKGVRQNYELHSFDATNDRFYEYYKRQGIIKAEEWQEFTDILKTELPASFRIRLSLCERDELAGYIEAKFKSEIERLRQQNEDLDLHPPQPIPFILYAYQTKMSRAAIRSNLIVKDFHEFLIDETRLGYISRQEMCSMLPPILLDIAQHHVILDACAAPGSKTMQIIELMHKDCDNPEGMLVANDVDYKRCYLLVHQTLKRMPTANCVVVCHDSAQLPPIIDSKGEYILFDRILCDVICSGDGTIRKNPELWKSWEPMKAVHLHKLQLSIARRCLNLLKPGGMMCYSTCSMNPLEDEAVVAHLLRTFEGKIELVDISDKLIGLKYSKGLNKWKVFNKDLTKEFSCLEDLPSEEKHIKASMFPPNETEVEKLHLERTIRILPHSQDSGGFFIAILRKAESDEQSQSNLQRILSKKPYPTKRRKFANKEDPFVFLEDENPDTEMRMELHKHFGVDSEAFPFGNLLVRSKKTERKKEIYFVNNKLREFLKVNEHRFRLVNAGVSILKKITTEKISPCPYRLKQDGLNVLRPWVTKRIINMSSETLIQIVKGGVTTAEAEELSQYLPLRELGDEIRLFEGLDPGSVILRINEPFVKEICAWIGANSVSAFVPREERLHLLRLFGKDISQFKKSRETVRLAKARRLEGKIKETEENAEFNDKSMEDG